MPGASSPDVERVVSLFFELRRSGRRVSLDEVLADFEGLADRKRTRTAALQAIVERTRSGRGGLGEDRTGGDAVSDVSKEFPELDAYDLIDRVGRGGMGSVYAAYQRATGRRVAVKFLLSAATATEAARRRFEREVELAARLQHPNIVSVLDSGIHQGQYYYVMEFVDGLPLDQAVSLGRCDAREALRLIAVVCDAVDYAHQRGVLHRDLKPSNILIDADGRPHLLDFGLAKAFDPDSNGGLEVTLSEPGQLLGTLGYMAPEQSRGRFEQMSVRSDVYSIGAIAYELITGHLPCSTEGALADVLARIANQDPRRPSAVRRGIGAAVNAILLKALEKRPDSRYATAGELASDIRRYLADRSIVARQAGVLTRVVRWVRRNRRVAMVGGAALLTIVILTAASFARIAGERDRAQRESRKARRINTFLLDLFGSVDPFTGKGPEVTVRELLDQAARRASSELAGEPDVQASLQQTLAGCYFSLGLREQAEPLLRAALKTRRSVLGGEHPDVAETLVGLGLILDDKGEYAEAETSLREALRVRRKHLGEETAPIAEALNKLAQVLRHRGAYEEAERMFREVLRIRRTLRGAENDVDIAYTQYHLGLLRLDKEDYSGAGEILQQSIAGFQKHLGQEHPLCILATAAHAQVLGHTGQPTQAERVLRSTLADLENRLGGSHPRVLTAKAALASLLLETGAWAEAEALAREVLDGRRQILPEQHPFVAEASVLLADCLIRLGRFQDAEPLATDAYRSLKLACGEDAPQTRAALRCIIRLYEAWGKPQLTEEWSTMGR